MPDSPPDPNPNHGETAEINRWRNILLIAIAIVVLIICITATILFFMLRQEKPIPTPTLVSTAAPVLPTSTGPGPEGSSDPVWAKIQETGILRIGTSADYPPFEFYTSDFQLDGFDIALIREIGNKMGLDVEIRDMAFDGLGGALQLNQVDVAIAAITKTDEREQFIDFSNIYFINEDAALAAEGSPIVVNDADALGAYRIGVVSGTIYEQFVENDLIETGKMPAGNLHIYSRLDQALNELKLDFIDLVLLDEASAELTASEQGFTIVGRGNNLRQIAIAMPQDTFMLRAALNQALTELQNEGRVAELISQYFNLEPNIVPPAPTPVPESATPTPAPPAGCIAAMEYVADLSYDDEGFQNIPIVPPGTAVEKGWRVLNIGSCNWGEGYALVPVDGNDPAARMGGLPIPVQGIVLPGQTYDFFANLTAPIKPGTYVEYWAMRNPNGALFGDRVWVAITVPGVPTPTPPPTATPSPQINFSADPETIQEGQCSSLTWSTENVRAVYVYPQGAHWQNYGVPGNGSQTVCPSKTTTYEMRVVKADGSVEIRLVTVSVIPNLEAPDIVYFVVEPPGTVALGQCVAIRWAVEGNVSAINLWRNDVPLRTSAPLSGQMPDCPPDAGQFVYKLEANGSGGSSVSSQTVQVVSTAPPTSQPTQTPLPTLTPTTAPELPTNTPAPAPTSTPIPPSPTATAVPPTATTIPDPIIYAFSATPKVVEIRQCVVLSWSVGGSSDQVQVLKNGRIIFDDAPLDDSVNDCGLDSVGTVNYEIRASNSAGGLASDQVSVQVIETAPVDPLAGSSWTLVSYLLEEEPAPVLEGTTITANFTNGEIAGTSGCNSYSAGYFVIGSDITIEPALGTNILCSEPAGVMQQEAAYLALLPTAVTYELDAQILIFFDEDGQEILTFAALVPTPAR